MGKSKKKGAGNSRKANAATSTKQAEPSKVTQTVVEENQKAIPLPAGP